MPARVSDGLKNKCWRAPANSKRRLSSDGASTVRRMVAGTRCDSSTQRFRGDEKRVAPRTGIFMDDSSIIPRAFPEVGLNYKWVPGRACYEFVNSILMLH